MSKSKEYLKGYQSGYKAGVRSKITSETLLELDNYWKEKADLWANIAINNQPPLEGAIPAHSG